jgi:hypothetical protein
MRPESTEPVRVPGLVKTEQARVSELARVMRLVPERVPRLARAPVRHSGLVLGRSLGPYWASHRTRRQRRHPRKRRPLRQTTTQCLTALGE